MRAGLPAVLVGMGFWLLWLAVTGSRPTPDRSEAGPSGNESDRVRSLSAGEGLFGWIRATRIRRVRREAWVDALDHVTREVGRGASIPAAVAGLAADGPAVLHREVAFLTSSHGKTSGFDALVDELQQRLAEPAADRFCEAVRYARCVDGGEAQRVLYGAGVLLRHCAATQNDLEHEVNRLVRGVTLTTAVLGGLVVLGIVVLSTADGLSFVDRLGGPGMAGFAGGAMGMIALAVVCATFCVVLRRTLLPRDARPYR